MKKTTKMVKTIALMAIVASTAACMSTKDAKIEPTATPEAVIEIADQEPVLAETVQDEAVEAEPAEVSADTVIEEKEEIPAEQTEETTEKDEVDVAAIAQEVIMGKWGNGSARVSALKEAGYDPAVIQEAVDAYYGIKKDITKQTTQPVIEEKKETEVPEQKETVPAVVPTVSEVSYQAPVQNTQQESTGDVLAHSDTERNYCDAYGCYDNFGDYRAISDTQSNSGTTYQEVQYQEPVAQENSHYYETIETENDPIYNVPTYDVVGDWHDPSYYAGKTIQIGGYSSTIVAYGGQAAVDAPGTSSAEAYEMVSVMDHAVQGFSVIKNNNVAYIGGQKFVKVKQWNNAKNYRDYLAVDGDIPLADLGIYALCMYTCNDWGGTNITITIWQPA